jgi:hypothetical protein
MQCPAPAPAPPAPPVTDDNNDTSSQASGRCATVGHSREMQGGHNSIYHDAFLDRDSDNSDDDGNSMDGRLDEGSNTATNTNASAPVYFLSSNTYQSAATQLQASARHVSVSLAREATNALQSKSACVSFVQDDHEEFCADSGATMHMLPDYACFVSYKSCKSEFVTLGDHTQLPIMGRGTARFYLNGKVIQVRDALHVPGLRAPLYSLRRHRHMQGCGYYSQFEVGSFILFPTFTIQVDDSEDNIVSFKSIGRNPAFKNDYTEPKPEYARPAHVIPDDNSPSPVNEMAEVQFRSIIVPKASRRAPPPRPVAPPTTTPTETPDDLDSEFDSPKPVTITDEELQQSAEKPLTKRQLQAIHENIDCLPDVPPSYTPGPAENTTTFDSLRLFRIFGHRRFKNQLHITAASKNAELITHLLWGNAVHYRRIHYHQQPSQG